MCLSKFKRENVRLQEQQITENKHELLHSFNHRNMLFCKTFRRTFHSLNCYQGLPQKKGMETENYLLAIL
jgi:hypothetical protein